MSKEDAFLTKFSEEDKDDFDMSKLSGPGSDMKNENTDDQKDQSDKNDDENLNKDQGDQKDQDKNDQDKSDQDDDENKDLDLSDKSQDKKPDEKDQDKKTDKKDDDQSKKDEKTKTEEDDLFSDFKSTETKTEDKPFDYKTTLTDLEIDVDENEDLSTNQAFVNKIKQTIEKSKQTLDLSKYPPEVRMIIESFQKNPEIGPIDFYRNDTIRKADTFLALSEDKKARAALRMELQKSVAIEDLDEAVEDKISDLTEAEVTKLAKQADRDVVQMRNKEYGKIIKEKGEWLENQNKLDNENAKKERAILKDKLEKTESFFGFKIPDTAKKIMIAEIENGTFQKYLDENVADTKILAYLGTKLGKKLEEKLKVTVTTEKNKSYKEGTDTIKKQIHNIASKSSGQQTAKRTTNDLAFGDEMFEEK